MKEIFSSLVLLVSFSASAAMVPTDVNNDLIQHPDSTARTFKPVGGNTGGWAFRTTNAGATVKTTAMQVTVEQQGPDGEGITYNHFHYQIVEARTDGACSTTGWGAAWDDYVLTANPHDIAGVASTLAPPESHVPTRADGNLDTLNTIFDFNSQGRAQIQLMLNNACEYRSMVTQPCFIASVSRVISPLAAFQIYKNLELNGHDPFTYDVNGSGVAWWTNWAVLGNTQWRDDMSNADYLKANPSGDLLGHGYHQHDTPIPPDAVSGDPTKKGVFSDHAAYPMDPCDPQAHTILTPQTGTNPPAAENGGGDQMFPPAYDGTSGTGTSTGTGTGTGTSGGTSTGTGTGTGTGTSVGTSTGTGTGTGTGTSGGTSTGTGTGTGTGGSTDTGTGTDTSVFVSSPLPAGAGSKTSTATLTSFETLSTPLSGLVGNFDTFAPTAQDNYSLDITIPWTGAGETKTFTINTVPSTATNMGVAVAVLRGLVRACCAIFLISLFIRRIYVDLVTY